jgi:hypothetical protein
MDLSREIDRILTRLDRLQRTIEAQLLPLPVGRQDFLIPRAGNQLLRSRAGLQPWQPISDGHQESGGADLTSLDFTVSN